MPTVDDWLEIYEELTDQVSRSKHQMFMHNLQQWFDHLDETPSVAKFIAGIETDVDFKSWIEECERTASEDGTLKWPRDKSKRLGLQLSLFRAFANEAQDVTDFASNFMYSQNNYDVMVSDVVDQLFIPLARDVRRQSQRVLEQPNVWPVAIPASDRTVRLDHNNPDYRTAIKDLETLEEAVRGNNDFSDPEDKEQRVAELGATRRLLVAARARVDALLVVAYRGLQYLAKTFADKAIGALAVGLLALLGRLTGLW
jgi:hypothetical protein